MSRSVRGAVAACALALSTVTPAAAGPSAEIAVGLSHAIVIAPSEDRFHPGFAPLVAALGWRVGSRAAVGLRSATYLVPATVAGQREPFLATFAGPGVWIWPGGDLVLGAAAGPALVWPAPVGASPYLHTNRGVALSLRAGWSVGRAAAGDVLVGAEILPTFFDGGDLLIGTLLTAGLLW